MTLSDSLIISVFGFTVVFMVLVLLSMLVKLQSLIIGYITENINKAKIKNTDTGNDKPEPETDDEGWSAGELKLLGVDEKTAAMIMAIVSHESQIPLSELQFKMIKAID